MSRSFNGSSDEIDCGNVTQLNSASAFTMAGWVKRSAANAIIMWSKYTGSGDRIELAFFSDGLVYAIIDGNFGTISGFNDTAWTHVVWAFDGSQTGNANRSKVYLNGVLQTQSFSGTIGATTSDLSSGTLHIGQHAGVFYSSGLHAEHGLWSAALDAAEAAALGAGFSPQLVRPASLVSYWKLQGQNSPEPDITGRYPGTLIGTTQADHPRIIYPGRRRILGVPPLAATFPFRRRPQALVPEPLNLDLSYWQQPRLHTAALFAGGVSYATPALVQSRSQTAADGSSIAQSFTSTTAAGGFLTASVNVSNEVGATVTPPTGWSTADTINNGTGSRTYQFYKWNAASVTSGTNLTFTFSAAAGSAELVIAEWSGVDAAADPLNQHVTSTGSGTTATTGTTGATDTPTELLIASFGSSNAITYSSPTSGFTIDKQAAEGVEGLGSICQTYRVVSSTSTYSTALTKGSSSHSTVLATYRAAVSGGVTPDSPTGGRRITVPAPNPETAGWPIVPRPPLSAQAGLVAQQALYRRPVSTFLPEPETTASLWWGIRGTFPQTGPTPPPVVDNPISRQFQQPVWEPPDPGDVWWRVRKNIAWQSQWIAQNPPPTQQPSQRVDPILDLAIHSWWQIRAHWPIPVVYVPSIDAPPTRQRMIVPPPREDPTPDYSAWDTLQIRQRFLNPFPFRGAVDSYGFYRIMNPFALREEAGRYRIAGIAGYAIYVGIGALPDLEDDPTIFSVTLPASVPVTPPVSGITTFHVVVRYRDVYGLESQNQKDYSVTIDSSGNLVLPPIPVPQNVQAVFMSGGIIRVLANYPTINTDEYPADQWQVWIGATPPVPGVDPPTRTSKAGKNLAVNFVNYLSGTWYLTVVLYRTADTALSPAVQKTVVIPSAPDEPGSTHGGYEVGY